ncbi:MAG: aspartate 1-decarboxylase [Thermoproteus sp. AZ2]|uniref:Aspartate 1-decarboxylase n=1 Tax=Thermoproteus sp. AZ2 TaxID=1609232 RepID=A0ACC6UYS9_9CREN|nr:MAG: aspartate decarboxylase [Thermoproteus sp. AZ2]
MPIVLRAKIHGAVVTRKNLEYEGSLTLGEDLLEASGIWPYERVEVYNINNGARFSTYVIKGEPGAVELNGAAARLGEVGDRLIIAAYECVSAPIKPRIVLVRDNKPYKVL